MLGVDAESDALDILPIDAAEKRPRRGRRQGDAERRVPRHWIAVALALAAAAGAAYWFLGPGDGEPDGLEAESAEFDDLLDGQTVRIEVEGLPSLAATVTVQCAAGGQEAALECDPTTARRASSSSNGTLDAGTTVWRVISTSNQVSTQESTSMYLA